uniref:RNA polymerase sigma factor n=1 Tax=Parabacteroides distasonis TaxID=823 RepID=UPI004028407E
MNLCNRSGRISRMADIDSEKERRLVADLLEGDESAFCELYALYKDRLMWFSLKFLKSRDMAEDVFQDAFASIWQNRRFLNPNVPFGPY